MQLPGKHAANVRRQADELRVRYLGGDVAIIDEVCTLRRLQEELAVERPEDPRRVFGQAVEATGAANGGTTTTELARPCTEAIANAVPGIIEIMSILYPARIFAIGGLVASLSFLFCLSVLFCFALVCLCACLLVLCFSAASPRCWLGALFRLV